jgi:serine/threonine protein kinase
MSVPAPASVPAFLEVARRSGVVDQDRLDAFLAALRAAAALPERPAILAARLVVAGLLTRFQADQLLRGKWRGFTLGPYNVLDRLGGGGMGTVILAEHVRMRRLVALKVLPASCAADPELVARFHREAKAGAALDHPNVVRVYDFKRAGDVHFLAMEYVDGLDLHQLVERRGPLSAPRAAHYIRQAAAGLHAVHQASLVHRDIKPSNLLLSRSGIVKILDLGLARFFHEEDDLTRQSAGAPVLGTADYLAPEQARDSHAVDIRADIYSLGATFYYLLSGQPPFPDGAVGQKLIAHQVKEPTPLRDLRPDVPAELAALVARMMAKDPADRYQTPAAVVEALAPWTQMPALRPPDSEMPPLPHAVVHVRRRRASESAAQETRISPARLAQTATPRPGRAEATGPVLRGETSAFAATPPAAAISAAIPAPSRLPERDGPSRRRRWKLWSVAVLAVGAGAALCWATLAPTGQTTDAPSVSMPSADGRYGLSSGEDGTLRLRDGKYLPLPLDGAVTSSSARGLFDDSGREEDKLIFPTWGPQRACGVPFYVMNPLAGWANNVIVLHSRHGAISQRMPRSVSVACNRPARRIHLLGGVSAWGYPLGEKGTVSLIVRLHYADGQVEQHPLRNGIHYGDHVQIVDLPESQLALRLGENQVRYLAIRPGRAEMIARIEFVKGSDESAPVVVAVTVEAP